MSEYATISFAIGATIGAILTGKLIQACKNIGTRSLLFGAHQFALHPIMLAIAWTRLFGFPRDPRLWVAFLVHDWGYWGKPNMDGKEGGDHPFLGAKIMTRLFDGKDSLKWYCFTLYHSRFIAKRVNREPSPLCAADKLATCITPRWIYLPLIKLTGEIWEYCEHFESSERGLGKYSSDREADLWSEIQRERKEEASTIERWYKIMVNHMKRFAYTFASGKNGIVHPEFLAFGKDERCDHCFTPQEHGALLFKLRLRGFQCIESVCESCAVRHRRDNTISGHF